MPINAAWRPMLASYATAAARPPYVSAISRRTTKVRLGVRARSPPIGIKHFLRQQVKGDSLSLSRKLNLFSPKPNTLHARESRSGSLLTWTSEGPFRVTPLTSREACVHDRYPRYGPRDKPTKLPAEDPRGIINPQGASTPTDVGGLAHSDENRSSRHLSLTLESFLTLLKETKKKRLVDVVRGASKPTKSIAMVASSSSNGENRQRNMQHEVRDMISTLTNRLMLLGRSTARSDAKSQEAGDAADPGLRVITLAGDNKGASMKADMEDLMDSDGGVYDDDSGMCTHANSNFQAVNNSILLGGSCSAEDPGVHLLISECSEEEEEEEEEDAEDDNDDDEHEKRGKEEGKDKEKKKEKKKIEKYEKKKKKESKDGTKKELEVA
ncbi:hypothetical protein BHE74_00003534 [Ensete ventricosum]|nr:hypothetical protein BHE74_00003534 [Ensete ventricosum]